MQRIANVRGVVAPHVAGAGAIAEDLRRRVQERRFVFENEAIPVTISLGAAELGPEMDMTAFLKAADEKLYEAKRSGRDRVVGDLPKSKGAAAS